MVDCKARAHGGEALAQVGGFFHRHDLAPGDEMPADFVDAASGEAHRERGVGVLHDRLTGVPAAVAARLPARRLDGGNRAGCGHDSRLGAGGPARSDRDRSLRRGAERAGVGRLALAAPGPVERNCICPGFADDAEAMSEASPSRLRTDDHYI